MVIAIIYSSLTTIFLPDHYIFLVFYRLPYYCRYCATLLSYEISGLVQQAFRRWNIPWLYSAHCFVCRLATDRSRTKKNGCTRSTPGSKHLSLQLAWLPIVWDWLLRKINLWYLHRLKKGFEICHHLSCDSTVIIIIAFGFDLKTPGVNDRSIKIVFFYFLYI